MTRTIAFQGDFGAFSHLACRAYDPELEPLPCSSFYEVFEAVVGAKADLGMIPVENTIAGRVADVHTLLPDSELFVIAETFQAVRHNLLGVPGAKLDDIEHVYSHVHALPQCARLIRSRGFIPHAFMDTAASARRVSEMGDRTSGAIASTLAAEIHGLDILLEDVQDRQQNTTRFLVLSRQPNPPPFDDTIDHITTLLFRTRNISAALYKCLGGFATNGINMTRLESHVDENFGSAMFFVDIQSHPDTEAARHALDELAYFAVEVRILGTYPAHPFRRSPG